MKHALFVIPLLLLTAGGASAQTAATQTEWAVSASRAASMQNGPAGTASQLRQNGGNVMYGHGGSSYGLHNGAVVVNQANRTNYVEIVQGEARPVAHVTQGGSLNRAMVIQIGEATRASVDQRGGGDNAAGVGQIGNANSGTVRQVGDRNASALMQIGALSNSAIAQIGAVNNSQVTQVANGVTIDFVGAR